LFKLVKKTELTEQLQNNIDILLNFINQEFIKTSFNNLFNSYNKDEKHKKFLGNTIINIISRTLININYNYIFYKKEWKTPVKNYTYYITVMNSKNELIIYKTTHKYTPITNSTKNKEVKDKVINYMREYKDEILTIPQKHHIDETIKIINKEIDTKLSYK